MDADLEAASRGPFDRDFLDQIAQRQRGGRVAVRNPARQRGLQIRELRLVARQHLRVQRDQRRRLGQPGELTFELVLLGRELVGARTHSLGIAGALYDRVDRAPHFAFDLRQAPRDDGAALGATGSQAFALVDVGGGVFGQRSRRAQLGAQRVEHQAFDGVEIERRRRRAGAALLMGRAAHADAPALVGTARRHAAAAGRATQQAGEKMARPALLLWPHAGVAIFARAHRGEDLRGEDRQFRRRHATLLAGRIEPRDALAGRRILHHAHPVPHQLACIERVEQDAVLAAARAVDGRGVPLPPARRRDAVAVQAMGDLARGAVGQILGEDAAHDRRLGLDDRQCARPARHRRVAIGAPAGGAAFAHHAIESAADFQRMGFQPLRRHDALEAEQQLVGLAVRDGEDAAAGKRGALGKSHHVGRVAGVAVDIFGEDDVEGARLGIGDQPLEFKAAVHRGAAHRVIAIGGNHLPALPIGILAAQHQLVGDRAVAL